MVSKSRKQRQVKQQKKMMGETEPRQITTGKSVHLKKNRPNMKRKMKVRMGHESLDIYDGFENTKQVNWKCPNCGKIGRVVGFCIFCEAAKISPSGNTAANNNNNNNNNKKTNLTETTSAGVRSTKTAKKQAPARK